jgi:hypothetical protein
VSSTPGTEVTGKDPTARTLLGFRSIIELGSSGRTLVLYHQTTPEVAASIIAGGFRPGSSGCIFGSAIYFAESTEVTDKKAHHKGAYLTWGA